MTTKRAIRLLRRLQEKYKFACGYPQAIEKAIAEIVRKEKERENAPDKEVFLLGKGCGKENGIGWTTERL